VLSPINGLGQQNCAMTYKHFAPTALANCIPNESSANQRALLLPLLRHTDLDAVLFQLGDKDLPDCRIFILVFDQVAAFAGAGLAQAMRSSATAQRAHEPF